VAEQRRFPAVDDPSRYDRIVERGRQLRRRRQLGLGAGAGSSVAAVAVAVALLTGGGGQDRAEIVADGDDERGTTTTTTTTTTSLPPPDELSVRVDATAERITVEVVDPHAPVVDGARQCVTVSMAGDTADTAEATGCDDLPEVDGVVPVELPSTGGVLIGCSATLERSEEGAGAEVPTELRATTFELEPPDLAAGTYTVEVQVASGVGDGCHGTGDEAGPGQPPTPGAMEHSTRVTATVEID